ncbi:MAG TPA: PIN domain-containing protein [Candidatus Saccharimonadales bacterium]|nr:PIN domain-containing protein [Candidatus Saccharimonadales bacterium]
MSGIRPKKHYWDACIYIAYLKGEQSHGPPYVDSIAQIAKDNFEQKNVIITSVITLTEVLSSKLTPEEEESFLKTFKRVNHILYDVDYAIATKARKFRESFLSHSSGKTLATPDAIHLATAAILQADELNTFDDGQKERKFLGLLELTGHPAIENLVICKPFIPPPPPPDQAVMELRGIEPAS